MKRVIAIAIVLFIIIVLIWTGLYELIEKKDGYLFIHSNFAMMNKALFVQSSEYEKKKQWNRTITLCRENAIRKVYLELTDKSNMETITGAMESIEPYGIEVGFWFDSLGLKMPSHTEIINQLIEIHAETYMKKTDIYFVMHPNTKDFITYKESYLAIIADVSKEIYNVESELPFSISIGWILPSLDDTETLKTTYNSYSKRLTFHTLDIVDEIALIPSVNHSFKSQLINEFMYANKLEKQVNVAIINDGSRNIMKTNAYINQKLQVEYHELIRIDPKVKLLFLDQSMLYDAIQSRYDLNRDGKVDLRDLRVFLEVYIMGEATEEHDFNHSKVVDVYDLVAIFINLKGK